MKLTEQLKAEDETLDTFYSGRILVLQKKKGYRFSVDAPLLADFIRPRPQDVLLELGTGNGIISLLVSIKPFKHITGVEIQKTLADLARRNVRLNHLEKRITILEEDLRTFQPGRKFDLIFSNPPYIRRESGHLSHSEEKSIAKHEVKCNIDDIMHRTRELLKEHGRACFIFPAGRKDNFMRVAETHGLYIQAIRFVHPRRKSPPSLFLVECAFSKKKQTELPPFILYEEDGKYTEEANRVFAGRINAAAY